jgi:hypothetical protein
VRILAEMTLEKAKNRAQKLFCSLSEQKQDHFLGILEALAFAEAVSNSEGSANSVLAGSREPHDLAGTDVRKL